MGEIDEIRRRYEAGELESIRQDLTKFIRAHREAIRSFQQHRSRLGGTPLTDELSLKLYIIKERSINPEREIQEQLQEIEKEKWIRGVQTGRPPDEKSVAMEWALKHGAAWRGHRVATIIFLLDAQQEWFLKVYRAEDENTPS
jgi:hypothetical protein